MKMTPVVIIFGALLIFWMAFFISVLWPMHTMDRGPSDIWRQPTQTELAGREIYMANGCTYCHSQYIRPQDWGIGAVRVAQPGDYFNQQPHLLGSERTGPDLSQEGGLHPDDWHVAHFNNPRFTRPNSIMPQFGFLSKEELKSLTAYEQSLGGKMADYRVQRQQEWKKKAVEAYNRGIDANIRWIHQNVPKVWRDMPNPYPPTQASLARGRDIYVDYCVNCHGDVGDGGGDAADYLNPPPLNFNTLKRDLPENRYLGGIFYYQIMNGITGTAMPYFKKELESAKIWDVSNWVAVSYVGRVDYQYQTDKIPAAYEGPPPDPSEVVPGSPQAGEEQ